MVLQNNLATNTHRAARYAQFVSLLKEVNRILEQKEAARILEEVRKLPLVRQRQFVMGRVRWRVCAGSGFGGLGLGSVGASWTSAGYC
jgi:hypothetical protein